MPTSDCELIVHAFWGQPVNTVTTLAFGPDVRSTCQAVHDCRIHAHQAKPSAGSVRVS